MASLGALSAELGDLQSGAPSLSSSLRRAFRGTMGSWTDGTWAGGAPTWGSFLGGARPTWRAGAAPRLPARPRMISE